MVDNERVAELMAAMGEGDTDAIFEFYVEFGHHIEAVVHLVARKRRASLRAEDAEALTMDVAIDLAGRAASWRADGAAPWRWAHHRIANAVDGHVGQWATSLDGGSTSVELEAPATGLGAAEPPMLDVVAEMADRYPLIALLVEGVERVAPEADRGLFFDYLAEIGGGGSAHAEVVGRLHDLSSQVVRKRMSRLRAKLRNLAESDPRFAPLKDLAAVA